MDPRGVTGPTRKQARGGHWLRTSHGFYVPARADQSLVEQRIVQAAAVLPGFGAVTGWASLRWQGGRWFEGVRANGSTIDVPLVTSASDIRSQSGFRVSAEGIWPEEISVVDGVRVTSAAYSVLFEMRRAPDVRAAVRFMDMAAYDDLASIDEVWHLLSQVGPKTGVPQAREALALSDENAWSPKEVDMRLIWVVDAGLPPPLCNVPIFDRSGTHIGTPDLFDSEAGVVGEYDGALHLEGARRSRDVRREELFRRHGLESFTMLAGDAADPASVINRMHGARARARFQPEPERSWTLSPPNWWTVTTTVARRRSLGPGLRERVLTYRRAS